jgi:hypothetical protein
METSMFILSFFVCSFLVLPWFLIAGMPIFLLFTYMTVVGLGAGAVGLRFVSKVFDSYRLDKLDVISDFESPYGSWLDHRVPAQKPSLFSRHFLDWDEDKEDQSSLYSFDAEDGPNAFFYM